MLLVAYQSASLEGAVRIRYAAQKRRTRLRRMSDRDSLTRVPFGQWLERESGTSDVGANLRNYHGSEMFRALYQ